MAPGVSGGAALLSIEVPGTGGITANEPACGREAVNSCDPTTALPLRGRYQHAYDDRTKTCLTLAVLNDIPGTCLRFLL